MKGILLAGILSSAIFANQTKYIRQKKRQFSRSHSNQQSEKLNKKSSKSAITYNLNGGRFGDNLFSYCKTKWLSYRHGIPLIYKPFQYSKKLKLHKKEEVYNRRSPTKFKTIRYVSSSQFRKLQPNANILYIKKWYCDVHADWKDEEFIKKLRKLIRPRVALTSIVLPKDCVTVAVHVRRGGGYRMDTDRIVHNQPLRFASDKFYIDQIKRLATMFKDKKLYVYIFTDDRNPQAIVETFKRAVNIDTVTYGCRKAGNNHYSHVLEDFFAMMNFDCLIRPKSHYSRFIERLGNNKIIIAPTHVSSSKERDVIDIIRIRRLTDSGWETEKVTQFHDP